MESTLQSIEKMERESNSIEINLESIEINLTSNWHKLKSIEINLKSIQNQLNICSNILFRIVTMQVSTQFRRHFFWGGPGPLTLISIQHDHKRFEQNTNSSSMTSPGYRDFQRRPGNGEEGLPELVGAKDFGGLTKSDPHFGRAKICQNSAQKPSGWFLWWSFLVYQECFPAKILVIWGVQSMIRLQIYWEVCSIRCTFILAHGDCKEVGRSRL